jgi:hypothetical protein
VFIVKVEILLGSKEVAGIEKIILIYTAAWPSS